MQRTYTSLDSGKVPPHPTTKDTQGRGNPSPASWGAAGLIGLGFLLRLFHLGQQSIWYDEGVSLYLAGQGIGEIIHRTAIDIHPPLYYILLHFWLQLAGDSEFAAAFMSVMWGTLLIALVYCFTSRRFDSAAGIIAALLIAVSPFQLWYAQEIRMYTLAALLGWLVFWSVWSYLQRPAPSGRPVLCGVLFAMGGALGLYTLYYFAFLLIAVNVWAVFRLCRERPLPRLDLAGWMAAQLAVVILYIPWLGTAVRQALNPPVPPWRSPTPLWEALWQSWSALSFGQSVTPGPVAGALVGAAVLYFVGMVVGLKREKAATAGLVLYTFLPLALILITSLWTPLFHVRYVFTYAAAYYVLLAVGIVWLIRRAPAAGWAGLAVWLAVSGTSFHELHYNPRYAADDFRGAVRYLADRIAPGDAVLINAGYAYPPFLYYYPHDIAWRGRLIDYAARQEPPEGAIVLQTGSIGGSPDLGWGRPDSDFYATDEAQTAQALERVFAVHPRLWVLRIYDTVVDPRGFVRGWLSEHGFLFDDVVFGGGSYMRVQGYLNRRSPTVEDPTFSRELGYAFGDALRLLGYSTTQERVRPGAAFSLDLYWQAAARPSKGYRVLVELVDDAERSWVRDDSLPLGTEYPTSRWKQGEILRQPATLWLRPDMPAGTYFVEITVYDPKDRAALDVRDRSGRRLGGRARLTHLSVEG